MSVYCGDPTPEVVPSPVPGVIVNSMVDDPIDDKFTAPRQTDRPPSTTAQVSKKKKKSNAGGDQKSQRLEKLFAIVCDIIQVQGYWVSHRKLRDILLKRTGEWFDVSAICNFREKHNLPRKKKNGVFKGVITDEPIVKGQRVTNWQFEADIVKMKAMVAKGERLNVLKYRYNFKRKNFIRALQNKRMTFTQACKKFSVPIPTGAEWWRDFLATGRLEQLPRGGDKRSTDLTPYHDVMIAKAETDAQMTVADWVTWLEAEHQQPCSHRSMERTLKQLGIKGRSSTAKQTKSGPSVPLIKPANQPDGRHVDALEDNDVSLPEGVEFSSDQTAQYDEQAAVVDQFSPRQASIPQGVKRLILQENQALLDTLADTSAVFTDELTRKSKKNNFVAMLYMTNLGLISGCIGFNTIAIFIENKYAMIKALLGKHAPQTPPKHTTFHNFIHYLKPKEYRHFFTQFNKRWREWLDQHWRDLWYSFDSKANRGSKKGPNQDALYTASIMGHNTRETVAILESGLLAKEPNALIQAIDEGEIPDEYLNLTADALNCKHKIAKRVHARGQSYVLAVKNNNPHLDTWVRKKFGCYGKKAIERHYELDEKHNKVRICCALAIPPNAKRPAGWEEVQTIMACISGKIVEDEAHADLAIDSPDDPNQVLLVTLNPSKTRHYVSNAPLTAEQGCTLSRKHWGIEENHHILDVTFQEDAHQTFHSDAVLVTTGERRRSLNPLLRLNTKDTIPEAQERAKNDGWHILAVATNILEKYPELKKYFSFK